MNRGYRFIPSCRRLVSDSLFYWAAYTASVVVFTTVAVIMTAFHMSPSWTLVVALGLSSLFLLSIYARRLAGVRAPSLSGKLEFTSPSDHARIVLELENVALEREKREILDVQILLIQLEEMQTLMRTYEEMVARQGGSHMAKPSTLARRDELKSRLERVAGELQALASKL